jgi:rhamnosyltransferase
MEKPVVSFVIRTKNEEKFIGKVLDLLQKQTYQNFEIIIVDSGSTDLVVQSFPNRQVVVHLI